MPSVAANAHDLRPRAVLMQSQVRDVDAYRGAVAGVDIEAIRTGRGSGPNTVASVSGDGVTVTACDISFPILSRTTTGDDLVIISVIRSTPPGSRWCEIDLRPGQVLAYGPAVEHSATNREGLAFSFAATTREQLLRRAEGIGLDVALPGRGEVVELRGLEPTRSIAASLTAMTAPSKPEALPAGTLDEVVTAMVRSLSPDSERPRLRSSARRLDSRRIVETCLEAAAAAGHVPALHELCRATNVSERRLRAAFVSVYDLPPSAFFRARLLDEARRRLVVGVPSSTTVSSVALDLGFEHLGRFAQRYRAVYGELPSETLRDAHPTFVP
jgi:AraC family ethanolamine operon transcriptional activator